MALLDTTNRSSRAARASDGVSVNDNPRDSSPRGRSREQKTDENGTRWNMPRHAHSTHARCGSTRAPDVTSARDMGSIVLMHGAKQTGVITRRTENWERWGSSRSDQYGSRQADNARCVRADAYERQLSETNKQLQSSGTRNEQRVQTKGNE